MTYFSRTSRFITFRATMKDCPYICEFILLCRVDGTGSVQRKFLKNIIIINMKNNDFLHFNRRKLTH